MVEKVVVAIVTSEWFIAAVIAALVRWLAGWFMSASGLKFRKYEGWAITAVKAAEKLIPDDHQNKAVRRLDMALRLFCEKYEKATGTIPSMKVMGEIESLIATVHANLEGREQL